MFLPVFQLFNGAAKADMARACRAVGWGAFSRVLAARQFRVEHQKHLPGAAKENQPPFHLLIDGKPQHIAIEAARCGQILRIENRFKNMPGFDQAIAAFCRPTRSSMPLRARARSSRKRASENGSPSAVP